MGLNLEGFNLVNLELSKHNNKLLNQPKRQSFAKLCEQAWSKLKGCKEKLLTKVGQEISIKATV